MAASPSAPNRNPYGIAGRGPGRGTIGRGRPVETYGTVDRRLASAAAAPTPRGKTFALSKFSNRPAHGKFCCTGVRDHVIGA